jgi:hypothetical protein
MKNLSKQLPLALLGLAVCANVHAAAYRLAFSKGENVEVFVDHADNQPWCTNPLALRFAFAGSPDNAAVARLLPKLGGLLASQCPSAATVTWKSYNAQGQLVANGAAAKAEDWSSHVAASPASAASGSESAAARVPEPNPTSAPVVPAPAPAPAPAVPAAAKAANPVTAPAPAASAASDPVPPPAPAVAAAPAPAPAPAPPAAAPAAATPQAADPIALPESPAPATNARVAPAFAVSGWTPPAEADAIKAATFFYELKDQNGCLFRTTYKPDGDANFVSAKSTGVTCGSDGYATGEGAVVLMRADGVKLKEYEGSFHKGIAFNRQAPALPIVGFDNQKNALMLLASDPASRIHYLLRASYSWSGSWDTRNPALVAVAENQELFRQLETIKTTVFSALSALDQVQPKTSGVNFIAVRDLSQGLLKNDRDSWLYEININRSWSTKGWQFNPQNANNYLFMHEAQMAERQRAAENQRQFEEQLKLQQAGYQAQTQLEQFARLKTETKDLKKIQSRLLNDVSYSPMSGGGYARLVAGGKADYSQIVHISGKSDGRWETDYPYESQLDIVGANSKPEKGWFLAKGNVTLDPVKRDGEDLPLTLVAVSYLQPCAEEGCSDLRDPLKLMRMQLGDDNWTPDAARQVFKQAWPDRSIEGDVQ